MIEILSGLILIVGASVVLIGGVGLVRFPDFFCRLHSAGVVDTLGSGLVLLALVLMSGSVIVGFKIFLIGALIFILSPVTTHALSNSALKSGIAAHAIPDLDQKSDGVNEDITV